MNMKIISAGLIYLAGTINFVRARRIARLLSELDDLIATGTPEQIEHKRRIVTKIHDMLKEMAGNRAGELYDADSLWRSLLASAFTKLLSALTR